MRKNLDSLLQKEMTRKEFLTTAGLGLMSLFGFSSILKLLASGGNKQTITRRTNVGYGASPYGGSKEA